MHAEIAQSPRAAGTGPRCQGAPLGRLFDDIMKNEPENTVSFRQATGKVRERRNPPAALAVLLIGMVLGFPLALATLFLGGSLTDMVLAFYLPPALLFVTLLVYLAFTGENAGA